eukprot:CAMPEP_0203753442 /NCGR_PEP_ID=MMETSP0098-20131031/7210_1 /ASSEMBLY_ACC=CAM_ASM_000208 /TAXON_ID=96639 /ORGANISM=" , Strain NY0313808BC1" /LENGTH=326 /DNA_ID=CAMNT_0050644039 /DNA_START=228 /DNA_END=1208 /DNA_ORIENTATION=-
MNETCVSSAWRDALSRCRFHQTCANTLVVSGWDGSVSLCKSSDSKATIISKYHHPAAVLDCAWGDGENVVSGGLDTTVRVHDFASEQGSVLGKHDGPVRCVEYCRDKKLVLTGGWDRKLCLWDVREGNKNKNVAKIDQKNKVFAMDVCGNKVIVGLAGRMFNIYDLRKCGEDLDKLEQIVESKPSSLQHQTRCVKFFPGGAGFAVGSIAGRVSVDYSEQGKKPFRFKCHRVKELIYPVNAISFHPVYESFATGGGDKQVAIWDPHLQKRSAVFKGYQNSISSIDFNCDGSKLAIAVSYTFEEGEQPERDALNALFIRTIQPSDLKK